LSYNQLLDDYFRGEAGQKLFKNLTDAETKLNNLLDLTTSEKISDVQFFNSLNERRFFRVITELESYGVRLKSVSAWRKQRQEFGQPQQAELLPNGEIQPTQSPVEQPKGFWGKVKAAPSALANVLSPAPIEESAPSLAEDPYETIPILYRNGCIMVEIFGEGMAKFYGRQLRVAIATQLTRLLRDIRTYTHGNMMDIGDQIASIAR
jgi:hypothetical protein